MRRAGGPSLDTSFFFPPQKGKRWAGNANNQNINFFRWNYHICIIVTSPPLRPKVLFNPRILKNLNWGRFYRADKIIGALRFSYVVYLPGRPHDEETGGAPDVEAPSIMRHDTGVNAPWHAALIRHRHYRVMGSVASQSCDLVTWVSNATSSCAYVRLGLWLGHMTCNVTTRLSCGVIVTNYWHCHLTQDDH